MAAIVELNIEDERWPAEPLSAWADAALDATLAQLGLSGSAFEVSLLACDDARIATLNGAFRDKTQPTNVLSWPAVERAADHDGDAPDLPDPTDPSELELGDIALAYETCAREAEEAGKPFDQHVTHLLVHAVLHLLGYDHERDRDAALMEGLEADILAKMGQPNPYV